MSGDPVVAATTSSHFLGEGPLWDPIRWRLLWVDILDGTIYAGTLRGDDTIEIVERVQLHGETVGAVGISAGGEWIVAGRERLYFRSPDGVLTAGPQIIEAGQGRRLNDGKADPAGRYLVGTLSMQGPSTTEALMAIDHEGHVQTLDSDLTLSNGLAWSRDGETLYSIDTERRVVFSRGYNADGSTGKRIEHLTFDDGYPDGMTIDAEDHLWIAMWGLGQVRRYSPEGRLTDVIDVPAPHTSSVAFAGPDLNVLVITTARQDLTPEQTARYPLSGHLFTARPAVPGQPVGLWAGRGATLIDH